MLLSYRALLALFPFAVYVSASCGYGTIIQPRNDNGTVRVSRFGYIGSKGPAAWASLDPAANVLCATGTNQSPINLVAEATRVVPQGQVSMSIPDLPQGADFENLGTTVDVVVNGGTLTYAGTRYTLQQFHFHLPSEHLDNGVSRVMELHTVWQSEQGQIAVVAAFLDTHAAPEHTYPPHLLLGEPYPSAQDLSNGDVHVEESYPLVQDPNDNEVYLEESYASAQHPNHNEALPDMMRTSVHHDGPYMAHTEASALMETVLGSIDQIAKPGTRTTTPPLIMSELADRFNAGQFRTYQGSLTTPPCTESVTWLVSDQQMFIEQSTFYKARSVLGFNARFPQNLPGQPNVLAPNAR